MTNKKFSISMAAVIAGATLLGAAALAVPAFAQTSVTTGAAVTTAQSTKQSDRIAKIIARSDTAITARINDLNKLSARVADMKNVDATTKSTITANIQTGINDMTTLKAKIDADTVLATLQADAKSITGTYRIYALVIPQGYIAASSDRVMTIDGMITAIGVKLQTRITTAQTAGNNVTALQAALTDMTAKVAAAGTAAQTAETSVATLVPDGGNATLLASNTAALKAARADIKTATSDLQAARQDIKTIVDGLKAFPAPAASATTSTSASTTTTAQ